MPDINTQVLTILDNLVKIAEHHDARLVSGVDTQLRAATTALAEAHEVLTPTPPPEVQSARTREPTEHERAEHERAEHEPPSRSTTSRSR
jgi:hypothetical protein